MFTRTAEELQHRRHVPCVHSGERGCFLGHLLAEVDVAGLEGGS